MGTAIVTGAAGSIGRALVARLRADGHVVVGLDLVDAPGVRVCDVTDESSVHAAVEAVLAEHGRIDLVVHNAGITALGAVDDHDVATHRHVLEVNHLGPLALTLAALPALRAAHGRIVLIGSVAGFAPVVGRPAYVASKHAVTGLFEALRPELARDGVGVTVVHPTFVTVALADAAGREAARSTTGAAVTPEQVADAIAEAAARGRDRVLVGRTARLAWHVHRLAPGLYARLMTRRLG